MVSRPLQRKNFGKPVPNTCRFRSFPRNGETESFELHPEGLSTVYHTRPRQDELPRNHMEPGVIWIFPSSNAEWWSQELGSREVARKRWEGEFNGVICCIVTVYYPHFMAE